MLALGDPDGAGLGVSLLKPAFGSAGDCAALRRSRLHCRTNWFYWPGRATADPPSGVGGLTRDGAAFCPVRALVLLLADIAARTLFTPYELATGIMTALVGAPLFILMASRMFK